MVCFSASIVMATANYSTTPMILRSARNVEALGLSRRKKSPIRKKIARPSLTNDKKTVLSRQFYGIRNVPVNHLVGTSSYLLVLPRAYPCLFFRQNGGESLLREEENPNQQLFHIALWIWKKKTSQNILFQTEIRPTFLEFSIREC